MQKKVHPKNMRQRSQKADCAILPEYQPYAEWNFQNADIRENSQSGGKTRCGSGRRVSDFFLWRRENVPDVG